MKYKDLKEGDFLYNCSSCDFPFGEVHKYKIKSIERNNFWTFINIGDYLHDGKDFTLQKISKYEVIDEFSDTVENLKIYHNRQLNQMLESAQKRLENINNYIKSVEHSKEIINSMNYVGSEKQKT